MALVANEPALLEKFQTLDGASSIDDLQKSVAGESCRFKLDSQPDRYQLSIISTAPSPTSPTARNSQPYHNEQETNFVLGGTAGSLFIITLAALFAFITYIFHYSVSHNGLPAFSNNIFVFQLYSYIPTAIGTLLEPFWVLLTRYVCVLQPFETLRRGNASAANSLSLKFESVPPALTIFSAMKSRHFFLSILAATALSTNILAISLGALFNPNMVMDPQSVSVRSQYQAEFDAVPFVDTDAIVSESSIPAHSFAVGLYDHYYAIYANFTSNTPLPAWTTNDQFFLPVNVMDKGGSDSSVFFQAETVGLSATLECEALDIPLNFTKIQRPSYINTDSLVQPEARVLASKRFGPPCEFSTNFPVDQLGNTSERKLNFNYTGSLALEAYPIATSVSKTTSDNETCEGLIPVVIARTQSVVDSKSITASNLTFNHKAMICRPTLTVNRYLVTLDSSNQIVNSERKEDGAGDRLMLFMGSVTEGQLFTSIRKLFQPVFPNSNKVDMDSQLSFSPNDLPTEWIDVIVQKLSNSTKAFDPQTPIEDIDMAALGQELSDAYSRVFAVTLGLYHNQIFTGDRVSAQSEGTMIKSVVRVEISTAMFALALGLLGWYILVATSSVLEDVKGTELFTSQQRETHLLKLNRRYGYGRFIGRDSKLRVGIEREPLLDHLSDDEDFESVIRARGWELLLNHRESRPSQYLQSQIRQLPPELKNLERPIDLTKYRRRNTEARYDIWQPVLHRMQQEARIAAAQEELQGISSGRPQTQCWRTHHTIITSVHVAQKTVVNVGMLTGWLSEIVKSDLEDELLRLLSPFFDQVPPPRYFIRLNDCSPKGGIGR
ncbi:hypothetical protein ABW20_dc0105041 [Dactylellina cionopaga]|nr:hypothetical protein ABW20_dc0105041 [Dactylellina cionopaga]